MASLGALRFDERTFDFEETNLYGIWEPHGHMTWDIELYPPGEDNYIMFNSLRFEGVYLPKQLSGLVYRGVVTKEDLYEHTVYVDASDRVLETLELTVGDWNREGQCITLVGEGRILEEKKLPAVSYAFDALLRFSGINMFETSREEAQKFVARHMDGPVEHVNITFERVASGLQTIVRGPF